MKILWAKSDFLHPTTKGGHIRTLEMLKRLHSRHQIHYVALDLAEQAGGVERSSEYCTKAYPIPHSAPRRATPGFWRQACAGIFSPLPLAISRYRSDAMRRQMEALTRVENFDAIVCDFLFAAPNLPDLGAAVLFQHNVEALIWKRHAEYAASPIQRAYFRGQYEKMRRYEAQVCRAVERVIAVSEDDARTMRFEYGLAGVKAVPTGVDLDYFTPPGAPKLASDLLFLGSMDWMPNIDAVRWFVAEVLPLIRARRPECFLTIAGRRPTPEIRGLAGKDARILVTGTVPDVRPHLWGAAVAIVPLRIGGGTRLKIYEAMAAKVPVVSTTIGAEGLDVRAGENIILADSARQFADACLALLDDPGLRRSQARAAWEMVSACYSWEVVARRFEQLLT
ncbi:MAG: glycosyltransferase family 4 protein [Acidobacteriia bacterium]|nr:glycosyltransferase family 4 protein [Terriglobia bacterium]